MAFPDAKDVLGQKLFKPEEHLHPEFQSSPKVIAAAAEIHSKLAGMEVIEAQVQYVEEKARVLTCFRYVRQLQPRPMFYWTVADQDEEGLYPFPFLYSCLEANLFSGG